VSASLAHEARLLPTTFAHADVDSRDRGGPDHARVASVKLEEAPYVGALSRAALGQTAETIKELRELEPKTRTRLHDFMIAARTLLENNGAESVRAIDRIVASYFRDPEALFYLARHLAYLRETDRSLELFRRAIAGGFFCYPAMAQDSWLDSLRGKTEFQTLLNAAGERHREAADAFSKVPGDAVLGLPQSSGHDGARSERGAAL
jgi:hypothetical protein